MSFIKRIKSLFKEEDIKVKIESAENLSLEQLTKKINDNASELEGRNKEIKASIKQRILLFGERTERLAEILQNIDIEKRKEHEKIKSLVSQNLALYISYLARLNESLKKIDEADAGSFISSISSKLEEFKKSSYLPFEKATILIGKELASVKTEIRSFSEDMQKIAESNRETLKRSLLSRQIINLGSELEDIKNLKNSSENELSGINDKINLLNNEQNSMQNTILKIKNSPEFRKDLNKIEEHKNKISTLENQISALKNQIDFKLLAKNYHNNPKKHQLVKDYSGNFISALLSDQNASIIEFAKEAQNIDLSSLSEIKAGLSAQTPVSEAQLKINDLEQKIASLRANIKSLESEISQHNKQQEKLEIRKSEITNQIKESAKLLSLNVN